MRAWGIATSAGMEAQVRALATSLGADIEMKRIYMCPSVAWLPNACFAPLKSWLIPHALGKGSDKPAPPWPDLVISCGRRAAQVAVGLRTRTDGKTKFIHIQDPQVPPHHFDLVVAMEHDKIRGKNVLTTRYALHAVTPATLKEAAEIFAPNFISFPTPRIAVLLGGSTNKYTLTEAGMQEIIAALKDLENYGSLLITPSRRTGEKNVAALRKAFEGHLRVYIYDGEGVNPYMGLLALANAIAVTDDSVNMMSEAAATGAPIHILKLPGHKNTKPARFAQRLVEHGIARYLAPGKPERWAYPVNDEMTKITGEIRRRLNLSS